MRTVPSGCSELEGLPALYYFWELFTLQFPGCSLPGFVKFDSIYAELVLSKDLGGLLCRFLELFSM